MPDPLRRWPSDWIDGTAGKNRPKKDPRRGSFMVMLEEEMGGVEPLPLTDFNPAQIKRD